MPNYDDFFMAAVHGTAAGAVSAESLAGRADMIARACLNIYSGLPTAEQAVTSDVNPTTVKTPSGASIQRAK